MAINYGRVPVIAELERLKVKYEFSGEEFVKIICPFHGDSNASLAVSLSKRFFTCHGCKVSGNIVDLIAKISDTPKQKVSEELVARYSLTDEAGLDPNMVEEYHKAIFKATKMLPELYKRAITDDDIRKFRIGYDIKTTRITIPVYDSTGNIVNIRKYAPGSPSSRKVINIKGRGKLALYPIEQLKYHKLLLCGGEIKTIAAIRQLNAHGIGAITTTGGEGQWAPEFNLEFKGKEVIICMDIDRAGIAASKKLSKELYNVADAVGILSLPLSIEDFPHGDINDYIKSGGNLLEILPITEYYEPKWEQNYDTDPLPIEFGSLIHAQHTKKRVEFSASVASVSNTPYSLPKKVTVSCTQDQKFCGICPITILQKDEFEIHAENECLLSIIDNRKYARKLAIAEAIGVPQTCKVCDFVEDEFHSFEKIRISQCLDIKKGILQDKDYQIALHNGPVTVNSSYEFTGRLYPSPETQALTFLLSKSNKKEDALDSFQLKDSEDLHIFQSEPSIEGIKKKLNEIYADFEANVTEIYSRKQMHLTMDLAYHSPLWVQPGLKGWAEVLIVGDTGQGKTQCAYRMQQFYKLGDFLSCNNVSFAGLVGGLKQYTGNKGWWIEWGSLPQNDRQLVILEELKGLSVQAIGQLTDIRSSGIVKIEKIEKRSTLARTRLVGISNPRDRTLGSYPYGILCINDLIGRQEDIRRFDFVYIVSKTAVPNLPELMKNPPKVEHRYTEELCRKLILWSWTSDVVFTDEARLAVLEYSEELNKKYECELELVTSGTSHEKLYRLSAALAARLFSHDDRMCIFVERYHVDFIYNFICTHYDSSDADYKTYASFSKKKEDVDTEEMRQIFAGIGDAKKVIRHLLGSSRIDPYSLQYLISGNPEVARDFIRKLILGNAIVREHRGYKLSPPFIECLKKFESNGALDMPHYLKKEEF